MEDAHARLVARPSSDGLAHESTWRSQASAAHIVLAALTNACGRKSGPVRATWAAVSRSSTAVALPADPGAVVVEQALADRKRLDDGNRVARELVLGPDAAAQQDRRREVRASGKDDDVRVDPLARRRDRTRRPLPLQRQAVDDVSART